ncbi:hybrid sensor histidine kinase/response regulator [candidate division WOR-3 bacterium]|nr:hybrid sensor histidine kinase/response regulator [candidate division WOR-3 bacterium]
MVGERLRILLVEDNPGDARLVKETIAEADGGRFEITHLVRCEEATQRLKEESFDVVLLDLSLPDSKGLETVARVNTVAPQVPIVIMTGLDDEEMAVAVAKMGAQDYLVKGHIDSRGLVRSLRYALERKRQELELAEKNTQLAKLSELKNQFLGMAAHDLRNPLTVIITCAGFLLEEAGASLPDEKKLEFIERIKANAEFMVNLINDLLDFTRIEAGQIELNLEPVELTELVAKNIEENRMLGAQKGIELKLVIEDDGVRVYADPARITQVLNNFLSNAFKFSAPGTKVSVRVGKENGGVRVAVKDQGQGIPADEMKKLFKPFQKTSVRSTAGERSTGLGLAICRQIIEAHKGFIGAESEPGKGSTFYFWLPVLG